MEEKDILLDECVEYAKQTGMMSSSLLQRRFVLGYLRARKIMAQMEELGVFDKANQGEYDKERRIAIQN